MTRFTVFGFLILLIFSPQTDGEAILSAAASVVSIVTNAVKLAAKIWDLVQDHDASFLNELKDLSTKNDLLQTEVLIIKDEVINKVTETVPGLVELNRRFSSVFSISSRIDRSYNDFLLYIEKPQKYDSQLLKEFALQAIAEDKGINHLLEEIHVNVVLSDATSPSVLHLLIKYIEIFLQYNTISKSPQQFIFDYLNSIIYTEVKGLLTVKFSYRLLEMYQGGNFEGHIEKAEHDFVIRVNNTVNIFKESMAIVSQELWKSDPAEHREEITFTELRKVFQEIIVNEYDISLSDRCWYTCSEYVTPSRKRYAYEEIRRTCQYTADICPHQRVCSGYVYNCRKQIETDMNICPSNQINRRYQFIDYGNGHRYGLPQETCNNSLVNVKSHYEHSFRYCDPCMCVCDDLASDSERYFNLMPSMAETKDNYVITGARLTSRNYIIHIQIQQGHLLPNGRINESTISWVPIDWSWTYTHKLTWDESREINLDDLRLPKNHVLTGLSFTTKTTNRNHERLHLKVYSMPMNLTSGTLQPDYQQEFVSETSKSEIPLHNLDIPTRLAIKNNIKSTPNRYLKFRPTGLHFDVGQSTIPFIDIQEVTANPPVPMSGAGFYHKSRSGSGGFIGLKLFTYDFGQHVKANLPTKYVPEKRDKTARLRWFINAQQLKSSSERSSKIFSNNVLFFTFVTVLYIH